MSSKKLTDIFLWIILVAAAGYAYHFYSSREVPCAAPIRYKIGTIDPRFGVSQTTFIKDIDQASAIWGNSIGRQLFVYDPKGSLTVNLIYDTRQAITEKENQLNADSAQVDKLASSVKQQYLSLEDSYAAAHSDYISQLARFSQAQDAYDAQVQYWNARGGAPKSEYSALNAERSNLVSEQSALQAKAQQVSQLASQINALIDKYNLLVRHVNSNAQAINTDGLAGTEFEEGEYVSDAAGERVDIYQFDSRTKFIRVLAHELGHALGLDHNSNPDSIMSPVNGSKSMVLSAQDLHDLKAVCGIRS